MQQEPPCWSSDIPALSYDHRAFTEFRPQFGTKIEALDQIYGALDEKRASGARGVSLLGEWLNASEFKSTLVAEVLKELLTQMRTQKMELGELKSTVRLACGTAESAELECRTVRFDLERNWDEKLKKLSLGFADDSRKAFSRLDQMSSSLSEWMSVVDKNYSELKVQNAIDISSYVVPMRDLQLRYEETSGMALEALNLTRNNTQEFQSRFNELAAGLSKTSELAHRAAEISNSNATDLHKYLSSGVPGATRDLEGRINEAMNGISIRIQKLESNDPLLLAKTVLEEELQKAGLSDMGSRVSVIAQNLQTYSSELCSFKMETSQKLQDASHALKSLQNECRDLISQQSSRLLALELQVGDSLKLKQMSPPTINGVNAASNTRTGGAGSDKEFEYYKRRVDEDSQLLQQVVHELRVCRKDLGLLIRRFESFCVNDLSSEPKRGIDLSIYESFKASLAGTTHAQDLEPPTHPSTTGGDKVMKNERSLRLCRRFINGNCKFGKRCWYLHEDAKAEVGSKRHEFPKESGKGENKGSHQEGRKGGKKGNSKMAVSKSTENKADASKTRPKKTPSSSARSQGFTQKGQKAELENVKGNTSTKAKDLQEIVMKGFRELGRQLNQVVDNKAGCGRPASGQENYHHGYHHQSATSVGCFRNCCGRNHYGGHC